ncbi:MAG: hypothetical protein HQL72_10855 [Magnetococcales bacterium]|nr:hypothetical protein [Magnetococcales bacterium]
MDKREALAKIRNKSCVPSLLWQQLTATQPGEDMSPLLLRQAVCKRLTPPLLFLKEKGFFQEFDFQDVEDKPAWRRLVILKLGKDFAEEIKRACSITEKEAKEPTSR